LLIGRVIFTVNALSAPEWDSAFPFSYKDLHLMGHRQPVYSLKVKYKQNIEIKHLKKEYDQTTF